MPGKEVHGLAGLVSGGVVVRLRYWEDGVSASLPEALGTVIGALLGALLPDLIEPASRGPTHRGPAHHVLLLIGIAVFAPIVCTELEKLCREAALRLESQAEKDPVVDVRVAMLRFLAGLAWGIPAGYLSHLASDVWTRKSLPGISFVSE